jgi:hypothetical protein
LRDLNLYRSKITDAGLAKLQALKKLETLDLRYSGVTSAGVQAFRRGRAELQDHLRRIVPPISVSKNLAPPAGANEQGHGRLAANPRRPGPHGGR